MKAFPQLFRIPKHLSVLFTDTDSINSRFVSDIVTYSAIYHISQVSFYDADDYLLTNEHELAAKIRKTLEKRQIDVKYAINEIKNAGNLDLHISFLGVKHGRGSVVEASRQLMEEVKSGRLSAREIDITTIDSRVSRLSIPEPDLLLKVGRADSLCGYPPWSLRATEIVHRLPGGSGYGAPVTELEFLNYLQTFSNRDIRLGK